MTGQLVFTDQSPSYCHGFEAGMLWVYLQHRPHIISTVVHVANRDIIERMAGATGYVTDYCASPVEGWLEVRLVNVSGSETSAWHEEEDD